METIGSVLERMKSRREEPRLVSNWKSTVPTGSRWDPDMVGKPDCPECLGVGYVRIGGLPVNHPDHGKMFLCDCAAEGQEYERSRRLLAHSGLSLDASRLTYNGLAAQLTPAVRAIRDALRRGWGWVYVWGPPGRGKTHLLMATVAQCLRDHQGAAFVTYADMLAHLRTGMFNDSQDFDERMDDWRSIKVLTVDEMGAAKSTDWTAEAERRVLNERYQRALIDKSQVTIFASNQAPESYSDWLIDRLLDKRFSVVKIDGVDLRRV